MDGIRESLKRAGRNLIRLYVRLPTRGKTRLRSMTDPWLSPRGDIETVRVGPCVLKLDHRFEATRNMAYGTYERNDVALLRRVLKPGDVAVDVGANVGYISAHMAQYVGPEGKVYSFEPGPTPFKSLLAVKESNAFGNMEIFPMAVADSERQSTYYEAESILSKGYGRIDEHPSDHFQAVQAHETQVTSLTAFFATRPIDRLRLIKIDVEGHEKQVIEGLTGLLDRGVRPVLLTEVTIRGTPKAVLLDYRQILATYGYEMYAIGRSLSKADPHHIQGNFHGNVAWVASGTDLK